MHPIFRYALLLSTALSLGACESQSVQQWMNPDHTFNSLPQPEVDGVNDTLEKQAKEAYAQGDMNRAGQFYAQIIGSEKGSPELKLRAKIGYAECLRRTNQNDKALSAFEEILKDAPDNLDAQEGHALTLMAAGKATDAGRAFSEIMKKDGTRWRTLNALGILFVTKNMVPEAMAYYTEALKKSPDNPAILNNVGLSQAVDKNYPRAIEALEQASRMAKMPEKRKQIDLNLALVYGVSGDLDTAKDVAGKYLEGPALENNLGLYAHLAKDDSLAKAYLNSALSDSEVFYERAWNNLDIVDKNPNQQAEPVANDKSKKVPVKKAPPAKKAK